MCKYICRRKENENVKKEIYLQEEGKNGGSNFTQKSMAFWNVEITLFF